MTIEFRCSQCSQLLRVPDDSAGKNARCPKCQSLMQVPAASQPASPFTPIAPLPDAGTPVPGPFGPSSPPTPKPPSDPFGFQPAGGSGFQPPPPKPAGNPFGAAAGASINPYASPAGGYEFRPTATGPIVPTVVPLDPIMGHAWKVWQANLGLLVGTTVIVILISYAIAIPQGILQAVLEQNNAPEGVIAVVVIGNIIQQLVQLFLGIGQAQISLKLVRGMPAKVGDLFGGGPRFLTVLGGGLIGLIVLYVGLLACIVPGILLAIWFWPFYYLLIEEKAGITDSFSLASKITLGNRGTTFVLALCGMGITLLGFLALCIGVIFALPLVSVMWATAYLMFSGQLSPQVYAKY